MKPKRVEKGSDHAYPIEWPDDNQRSCAESLARPCAGVCQHRSVGQRDPPLGGRDRCPCPRRGGGRRRVCATAVPGFDAVREQFTYYDEQAMHFAYQATDGHPFFIKRAENHLAVRSLGPETSIVESRAEVELSLVPGVFLAPLLKFLMGRVAAQFFEELKYYVEHDQPHPRKLKAQQKQMQKAATRS